MTNQSSKTRIPAHPETRDANRDPISGAPGAHPVGTGVGAAGGAAGGAAIGAAVGGPIGAVVGAAVGGIAGGLAGKGAAEVVNPTAEEAYWRENYTASPVYESGKDYDYYKPAYQTGYMGYGTYGASGKRFEDVEPELRRDYETKYQGGSAGGMAWERAKPASRQAWDRVHQQVSNRSTDRVRTEGQSSGTSESIRQLNSYLRGEMSAVATYQHVLTKYPSSPHASILRDGLTSHERRVQLLKNHIGQHGGDPSDSSGAWGGVAKAYESVMSMMGEKSAIAALESGEDHGLDDIKRGLDDLDGTCRAFVERDILPEQERTHRAMSDLKHRL